MKKIFYLLLFFTLSSFSKDFEIPEKPSIAVPIYDYIGLLTLEQKDFLNYKLSKYFDTTSTQIVIAIINSVKPNDINVLGADWAQKWKIGISEKDNGIFILVAKNDRKITIRTGFGVEGKMTTFISNKIINESFIPYFKNEQFFEGLNIGTDSIIHVLNGEFKNDLKKTENIQSKLILIFIVIIVVFLLLINKKGKGGQGGNGYKNSKIGESMLMGMLLGSMGRSGLGGSSYGGGGGFSGGFGGGGFSGGGSSGGW